jgi:saccharopine dehydrogenase-like NADP-dependent oxidoreductase
MRCFAMREGRPLTLLLIGASGVFGSRLAALLVQEPDIALTLAGRRRALLDALAKNIGGGSVRTLDRDRVTAADLAGYDLVVDCAGPFQGSGTALADAALAARIDYADLADDRDWVAGFAERYGARASAAGIRMVTGASSIPALSHAVLDRMTGGWRAIDRVAIGIFPGNRAPRGLSVVEAILSYAGRPVRVFDDGRWQQRTGWGETHRVACGAAGRRWASICDTPEQDLLVERYRPRVSATFHAGMELGLLHLGLAVLTIPVRLGWLRSLRPFARPLLRIAQWVRPLGSDRGAMRVAAQGVDGAGRRVTASWLLEADGNRGPNVPIVPTLALVRRLREGRGPAIGAYHAGGLLDLDDMTLDLCSLGIVTRFARPVVLTNLNERTRWHSETMQPNRHKSVVMASEVGRVG